ncbi:protein FAR1-RELATED SEQUENCE 5 isoform X2 [Nicotiana tabacum]|nr:PREDICTED: protein FAR1-RELATED SEQUENCE 5-like isoform X2 [Nicotiana sylvestris]XP_016475932.1 PREDICTED: protein FAR1-RELATED SEQUENCE 5-like isoform X2 [Nicotiana tabacum]
MESQPLNLENDAMEFDVGSGEEEEEEDNYKHSSSGLDSRDQCSSSDLEPYEGMEFESEQAARIFYNSYARRVGFGTRVSAYRRSRRDNIISSRQLVCSKEGFNPRPDEQHKPRRQRIVSRVGCKAHLTVKKQASGKWAITKFVKDHNHELVPPDQVHLLRSHRHVSGPARSLIDTLQAAGLGATRVMSVLIKQSGGINNVGFTKSDCQNYMNQTRQRTLGTGAHYILEYLKQKQAEDPGFFYVVQGGPSGNIFWADSTSRMNYSYFGDTVTFDTTYRTHRFRVPFAPFIGVNHHCQPVLFGCALLLNESESSFIWLFQNWLAAMSGRHPVSITTDHDRIIRSAIADVFPGARHRFCKSNIFRQVQERLSHSLQLFPIFEAEFQKCVNSPETIEEFELCWESLLGRYNLKDDEWLHSMYDARQHWVPIYLRDTFFGETSIAKTSDTTNSFFDGYIDASTNIHILMTRYEKATASRHEKEVKAENDTIYISPILKTPSPMEKQAANLYTREIFLMFQRELMETLAYPATVINDTRPDVVYQVAKFGEDHKVHYVQYNVFEKKASCSCQLFAFSGIPCKHILAVFRVKNILRLPSHYVLKRWTRKAKSEVVLDEDDLGLPSSHNESFTARFEKLSLEATKYVKEGVDSENVYKVAMDALRGASKKVAAAMCSTPAAPKSLDMNKAKEFNLNGNQAGCGDSCLVSQDEKILELTTAVVNATGICEAYRAKLLSILREMEEQKLRISLKIQSMRFNQMT